MESNWKIGSVDSLSARCCSIIKFGNVNTIGNGRMRKGKREYMSKL